MRCENKHAPQAEIDLLLEREHICNIMTISMSEHFNASYWLT